MNRSTHRVRDFTPAGDGWAVLLASRAGSTVRVTRRPLAGWAVTDDDDQDHDDAAHGQRCVVPAWPDGGTLWTRDTHPGVLAVWVLGPTDPPPTADDIEAWRQDNARTLDPWRPGGGP